MKATAAQPTCWIIITRAIEILADKIVSSQHNMKFDLKTPNAGPQCSIKSYPSCMTGQINV